MKQMWKLLVLTSLCLLITGVALAAGEPLGVRRVDNGAITVDGNLSEWTGPANYVSSAFVADAVNVDNDDDLSAFAMFAYDDNNLYGAFRIIDDVVVMDEAGSNVWKNDCIEWWIEGEQLGLTMVEGKPYIIPFKGNDVTGTKSAVSIVAGGYIVEVSVPKKVVESLIGKSMAKGSSFQMAFGIDDADTRFGERDAQIYFPFSWTHSQPATFATATFE